MFSDDTQTTARANAASGVRTELVDQIMEGLDPVATEFYLGSLDREQLEQEACKALALEMLVDRLMAELGMVDVSREAQNIMHLRNLVTDDVLFQAEEWGVDLGDEYDEEDEDDHEEEWDEEDYDEDEE